MISTSAHKQIQHYPNYMSVLAECKDARFVVNFIQLKQGV